MKTWYLTCGSLITESFDGFQMAGVLMDARSHDTMGTSSDFCIQNWGDRCVNLLRMSHDLSPNC